MNRRIRAAFRTSLNYLSDTAVPEGLFTMSNFLGHLVIPITYSNYIPVCTYVEYPKNNEQVNHVLPLYTYDSIEVEKAEDVFYETCLSYPTLKKVIFDGDFWYVGHGIILDSGRNLLYLVTKKKDNSKVRIFVSSYIFYKKKDKLCKYIITQVLSEFCMKGAMYGADIECLIESLDSFIVIPQRPNYDDDFDKQVNNFLVGHVDDIVESLCNFITFEENS